MMNHNSRLSRLVVAAVLLFCTERSKVLGYEIETHEVISEVAVSRSSGDDFLRDWGLGETGLLTETRGQSLIEWLKLGSIREDNFPRFSNHFHNPLAEQWNQAGLGSNFGQSSILWGQNPNQSGPSWSWQNARQYLLDALTRPTQKARDQSLARTFEGLGRLIHLIQDAASPAHTRNDPHVRYNYETLVRDVQRADATEFERWVNTPDLGPDPGWRTLDADPSAPIPIARLIDTDLYKGDNPAATVSRLIGLAEYSNANFFSEDRIFTENDNDPQKRFPYPRRSSTTPADFQITLRNGAVVTRQYFRKDFDGDTGYRLATVGFPRDYIQRFNLDPNRFGHSPALDETVYRDYAERLVPRAVAYSTALLDYFFRGRLDVELFADPADPSRLRLEGTNASPEALIGGTLTLYADNANGIREAATVVEGSTTPTDVASGGEIISAWFQPNPADAERFVAVYTGTLGAEQKGPSEDLPGAVIGKVLGGQRVEELFTDGARWHLRTPKGVFPLPIVFPDIEDLRWGDADNTLVGRTAFGMGQPNRLKAWQIERSRGSADVPLDADQMVKIQPLTEASFEKDPSDPTKAHKVGTLTLVSIINYQQYLISYFRSGNAYSDPQIQSAVSGDANAVLTWDLVLDFPRFNTLRARPYLWQLAQIGLSTDGDLLALVRIRLTQPDRNLPESFAVFPSKRFVWCGTSTRCPTPPDIDDGSPAAVPHNFPRGATNHWALVNVSKGEVVYSTAADSVVLTNVVQETRFRESSGGPFNGLTVTEINFNPQANPALPYGVDSNSNLRFGIPCFANTDFSALFKIGPVDLRTGSLTAAAAQYRPELAQTAFEPFSEHILTPSNACFQIIGGVAPEVFVEVAWDEARVYLNDAVAAERVPDGSERVALVYELPQGLQTNFGGSFGRLAAWDPPARSASRRHEILEGNSWRLVTAARDLAVMAGFFNPGRAFVVPLSGSAPVTDVAMPFFEVQSFRGLSPAFLYHVENLRFYRYRPNLKATVLPALLAPVPGGNPVGDYHLVRVP